MKRSLLLVTGVAASMFCCSMAFGQSYVQNNLVATSPSLAPITDLQLKSPWGLTRSSDGAWRIAATDASVILAYDGVGGKQSAVVNVPPAVPATPIGLPITSIFNGNPKDFLIAPGQPASLLISTIDGAIAGSIDAGSSVTNATIMIRNSDGSVYSGLAIAVAGDRRLLYAANVTLGRVDVFDTAFRRVTLPSVSRLADGSVDVAAGQIAPFFDRELPTNYRPFNVQTIGNDIVVTYVRLPPGATFPALPDAGPGLGYVNIFNSSGQLLRRLEHGPWFNVPWGVALAPLDFGRFSHHLLIAQFGSTSHTESSGVIAAFDLATGQFAGLLRNPNGQPLAIDGLLALATGNVVPGNRDPKTLPAGQVYFTAEPHASADGLLGYLSPERSQLIEGSGQ